MMSEIYIFNPNDELLTILSEDNGLISAPFKESINEITDSPLTIIVDAEAEYEHSYDKNHNLMQVAGAFVGRAARSGIYAENVVAAKYIQEENRVVFRDRENKLREYVIKEVDDVSNIDGAEVTAICFPAWVDELNDNYVLDKRYTDKEAQDALNDALEGTRYIGEVQVSLGRASTSFYKLTSTECIFKIIDTWGGEIKDEIELNDLGRINKRKIIITQRLGSDKGLWFEVGHNTEEIKRTVLSYPKTALYGWGASLEITDEDGEHTGGYTRYIDFGDVEWKVSNGDPVDKPKGQKWVGSPQALREYGRKDKDGTLLHRYGEFNDQNIEDPEELLLATYNHLIESASNIEVNYQLSVQLLNKPAELGDTAVAKDYSFAKPITIQTRIISIEYDLLDKEDAVVEMGQFLDLEDDRITEIEETIEGNRGKWDHPSIENENFPDRKPNTPKNIEAFGGINVIQVYWDFDNAVYVSHYEVYGSKVKDFIPDTQHLLWRGRVSAFAHEVEDDDTWYYRVRAINTRGTASEFSAQASASAAMNINDELQKAVDRAQQAVDGVEQLTTITTSIGLRIRDLNTKNLITHNPDEWISIVKDHFIYSLIELEAGKTYTITDFSSEEIDKLSVAIYNEDRNYIRGIDIYSGQSKTFTLNENEHYAMILTEIDDPYFIEKLGTSYKFKLEAGEEKTTWTNHDEDLYSQYSQLSDAINLRVVKNEIINEINVSPEGILINGSKLWITAQTIIDSGVIGRAQIADLAVDNAKIANSTITSAKIASLNVDKITGSIANFVQTGFNNVTNQVSITGSGLETYSGGQLTSLLYGSGHRFYRNNTLIGTIGTAGLYEYPSLRGLNFQLSNDAHYMSWSHLENKNDPYYTIKFGWYKNSQGDTEKGFVFSDHITLQGSYNFYVRTLSTVNYTNGKRHIQLQNFSWNDNDGVMIRRSSEGAGLFLTNARAAMISGGNAYIEVSQDSTGNRVHSIDIYNRRYSGAANVYVTSSGTLGLSTSARKYKRNIEVIEKEYAYNFFENATPVYYKSKNTADKNTHYSYYGYIADDIALIEPRLVQFNKDNEPESFNYDRVPALLHVVMKFEKERLDQVEKNLNELDGKVVALELKVQWLKERIKQLEGYSA